MEKNIKSIIGFTVLLALVAPALAGATTTASSTAELIASLQQQIEALRTQITALNVQLEQAQAQVKTLLQLTRQLRFGTSGDDVKTLQEFLATDPSVYPEGLITGYYGKLTENAIKRFQSKICIDQVGNVGPKTMWRINELLTEGAGNSGKIPPGLLTAPGIQKKLCSSTTTPDTTAPVISNVMATSTTATTTLITWTTDESANSKVYYGTVTPVDIVATSTPQQSSSDYLLAHEILLSDLATGTTYYYVVSSADKSGNVATSTESSFLTLDQ